DETDGIGVTGTAGDAGAACPRPRRAAVLTIVTALGAALIGPMAASASIVAANQGPFGTPYQGADVTRLTQGATAAPLDQGPRGSAVMEKIRGDSVYLAAVDSALAAAPIVYLSGDEVLPLGGFSGAVPWPTTDSLADDVASGRLRFALLPDNPGLT